MREWFDRPAITTDVIAGFPQETEEEFQKTVEFLKKIHFYEIHVFKYSRRAGTRAAAMEGQLPEAVKAARSDLLLTLEQKMSREYRQSFLGEDREVLLEEKVTIEGEEYLIGHTREYVKAALPWKQESKFLEGRLVTGRLISMINPETLLLQIEAPLDESPKVV